MASSQETREERFLRMIFGEDDAPDVSDASGWSSEVSVDDREDYRFL